MYYTDGRRAVLTLANVPSLRLWLPRCADASGPGLAQTFARAVRWSLPKEGRERAAKRAARSGFRKPDDQ